MSSQTTPVLNSGSASIPATTSHPIWVFLERKLPYPCPDEVAIQNADQQDDVLAAFARVAVAVALDGAVHPEVEICLGLDPAFVTIAQAAMVQCTDCGEVISLLREALQTNSHDETLTLAIDAYVASLEERLSAVQILEHFV
jgi:hypothetical protein